MRAFSQFVAEAAGPVYRVYHGTNTRITTFSPRKTTQGIIWFTSDRDKILRGEAGAQGRGLIITADVRIERPAGWKAYEDLLLIQLRRDYDGVVLPDPDGTFDLFVWDASQITIVSREKV